MDREVVAWSAGALALLSAALFAVASAVQQRSAAAVPEAHARGLGLLWSLVRSRRWWTGTLADSGGYVAQATALGLGSLLLVQPLLVTTVLFALPLSARWARRRLGRADWAWSLVLALALAAFVVVGDPTAGVDTAAWGRWVPALAVLGALCAGCLAAAAVRRGASRALLVALAAGLVAGLSAALTKGVVGLLDDGPGAVLTHWSTYLLVATLLGGTFLQQSAYQAGPLTASLPAATVGEPVVSAVLGVAVLQERLRADGAEWALIAVLVAAMTAATVALARSSVRPAPDPLPAA
ncbi:DMT family transporter [Blastococcus sp. SYSU D00695]